MQWVASTLNCNETASPSKRNYRQLEMWTKQRKVGQRERDNRGTPPTPLQPGPTTVQYFAAWFSHRCSISKFHWCIKSIYYRCFMGIFFMLLEEIGQGPAIIATFISHNPSGCIGSSIMGVTPYGVGWCSESAQRKPPFQNILKHTFIHIKPHPNNMWNIN